ncbi:hypothetical protein FO519_005040 [Halicephalobus sp. NKZ332]|nr:hypothetical protein FO519_005040 [Halicephalobus sp. NKZ332]
MTSTEDSIDSVLSITVAPENETKQLDRYIASSIMFIVGICGIIANISAIRVVWRFKIFRNCFGYLLILHASTNTVVLCSFVFWAVPITLLDESLARSVLGFKIGQIMMGCYYATFYAQLAKAFNRLFAIANPIMFRRWFSNENVKFILLVVVIFGLIHGTLYFLPGCNFYYNTEYLEWDYDETSCYDVMAIYVDLIVNCSIIGITMFIDSWTLFLIVKYGLLKGKISEEVRFFIQAFATSILYSVSVISDQVLYYLNSDKWYGFMTATFAWEICHTIDGGNLTDYSASDYDYQEEEEFSRSEQYIGVAVIIVIGVCGLTANIAAIIIVCKSKNLWNCFGRLLILHASANTLILCVFVFWAAPITLFNNSLSRSTLDFKIGQVVMVFYYITFYVQLFKAINRFIAIFSPIIYRRLFSRDNITFILLVVVTFGLIHGALYFIPGCNLYYDTQYLGWDYSYTPCYDVMAIYIDLIIGCSIIGLTMLIDTCTLCLIIKNGLFNRKNNRDVKFFIQTFSASILYTVMVISEQVLSYLNSNKWYGFVTATFAWEMCHTIDG